LAKASEKSYNGLMTAQQYAGSAATSLKQNANSLYEKNYHGQLAEGVKEAYTAA
jgi:hypothetical protein